MDMKLFLVLLSQLHLIACENGKAELPHELSEEGSDAKKLNVLMLSDFPMGHIAPLIAVGEELSRRGHNVTLLITVDEKDQVRYKTIVENHGVTFWNVTFKYPISFLEDGAKMVSKNFALAMVTLLKDHVTNTSKALVKPLNASLGAGDWDLVIGNNFMQPLLSCMHAVHRVPFVYLGVNLEIALNYPPWPWPGLPMGASSDNMMFVDRLLNMVYTSGFYVVTSIVNDGALSAMADYCPSVTISHTLTAVGTHFPSIIPSVIGFEYPRTVSAMTDYVGPLLSRSAPPLSGELEEWLGSKPDKSVVYVSMGSLFALDEENGRAILEGVMKTNHSMLWAMRKSNQWILDGLEVDPDRVLISEWTPQFSVLASSAIHSAILHGGFNGLNEALWNGVPIVVFPQMHEQIFNAGRVHFNELGIHLDPKTISSSKIAENLRALDTGEYRSNLAKIQKTFRFAGGVNKAADLVEFYAEVGYAHLVPAYAKYQWSWVQYYNADVYAVLAATLLLVLMCMRTCYRCMCKRCSSKNKQKED